MAARRAMMDGEAARYRLQARLAMIAKVAKTRGDAMGSIEVTRLRKAVDAVRVGETEESVKAAIAQFEALRPQIDTLQASMGIEEYATPRVDKWVRFVSWTLPPVTLLIALVIWVQIRRRKRAVDDAALAALDRAGSQSR